MNQRNFGVSRSYYNRIVRRNLRILEDELNETVNNNEQLDDANNIVEGEERNFDFQDNMNQEHGHQNIDMADEDYVILEDNDSGSEDYDSSSPEEDDPEQTLNIEQDAFTVRLATLIIKYRLSRNATNELLMLLREYGHINLPKSKEALLHTPSIPIVPRIVYPGEYHHIGLKKCLLRCNYEFLNTVDIIDIDINIDGLSLSISSLLKVWPILGAFTNRLNVSPFVIGAYVGYANPASINDFLIEFVDEVKEIQENGCEVTPRKIMKQIRINSYICDAPARAFLAGVKSHLSLVGCNKCDQVCDRRYGTRTYQPIRGQLRTDETFQNRTQLCHHQPEFLGNPSLLETLGTGMVSQIVNDPMHLVDEGVFARSLESIFFGNCRSVRLQNGVKQIMDNMYISFGPYVPLEFERSTRSIINELSRFKGTEFRFWGLYAGFIILKKYAGTDLYNHFLKLFCAIRILSSPATHIVNANFAEQLLESFVLQYGDIYEPQELVYNIHSLLHIVEEVRKYGPLYSFSAYKFENHMREIKKYIRKPNQILQQISKRLEEINVINDIKNPIGFVGRPRAFDSDTFPGCTLSYKGFKFDTFVLKNNLSDSCCMLNNGDAIEVQMFGKINNEQVVFAKKFANLRNFFTYPMESAGGLGILLVDPPTPEQFVFKTEDVKYKFVRLPYDMHFVLIPILHNLIE